MENRYELTVFPERSLQLHKSHVCYGVLVYTLLIFLASLITQSSIDYITTGQVQKNKLDFGRKVEENLTIIQVLEKLYFFALTVIRVK